MIAALAASRRIPGLRLAAPASHAAPALHGAFSGLPLRALRRRFAGASTGWQGMPGRAVERAADQAFDVAQQSARSLLS